MSTAELPKQYDPQDAQRRWYAFWLEQGYFHADPASTNPPYTVMIPPPNVTGALHLGHALNNTIQDILVRWRRMQGYEALWMPGTDHAGIATQAVVETRLRKEEGKTRHDIGRENLVERIWAWKDEYEARILGQLRQMGCSCDWDRTRFTLDPTCARAVRETFFQLFRAGKIYRGKRLVNWDTHLRTAVADDEIEYVEQKGQLWTIRYPVDGSDESLLVATTRPETMLGDTAVAIHPEDPRYKHLLGRSLRLPLSDRLIPVIGDAILVDPKFGTGCVKVTPAHDPNDYATGQRHDLPSINLLNPDGTYNENAGDYAGLDRYQVRKRVVADLEAQGLLAKVEPYTNKVGLSDRSKTPIEPYLSDQWFVRMGDDADGAPGFAQQAIDAVESGAVTIHPSRYGKSYSDWLGAKRDWCISRQLWWGHQIPVWRLDDPGDHRLTRLRELSTTSDRDRVYYEIRDDVAYTCVLDPEADPDLVTALEADGFTRDPDVLDTWFSSALWPHSTLGWPEPTAEMAKFYPTSVLSTARDIITLWVARMVIFSQFNTETIPFRDVYIHPVIQDGNGKRMSKSAGNGVDPVDIIDLYGADALRFTLASLATETQDLRIPVEPTKLPDGRTVNTSERFEQGRTFPNKVWNASRFALMNLSGFTPGAVDPADLATEDRWILSLLARVSGQTTADYEAFRFAEATRRLRDFVWNDVCDCYVEVIKGRLRDEAARPVAQRVLATVLDGLCRLLHPTMPFLTESIWQALAGVAPVRGLPEPTSAAPSVCIAPWPNYPAGWDDPGAESTVVGWRDKVAAIRKLRAESKVPEKAKINPILVAPDPAVLDSLRAGEAVLRTLTDAATVAVVDHLDDRPRDCATVILPDCEILLPLEGLIDHEAERLRLRKSLADLEKQIAAIRGKLGNEGFVSRAPAEVVAQQRAKLADLEAQQATVRAMLPTD